MRHPACSGYTSKDMNEPRSRRLFLVGAASAAAAAVVGVSRPALAKRPGRAWLGVELAPNDGGGVLAKRVLRGSPADKGGVKAAYVIATLDGAAVSSPRAVVEAIAAAGPGATLTLHVRRGAIDQDVKILLADHPGDEEVLRLDKVGTFAPGWKGVHAAKGDVTDIKKLKGRVVLVDFWASWCVACRMTTPELNAVHEKFGAQGLTVVGLTDDEDAVALKAADSFGIKYAVGASTSVETMGEYGVRALPTMFFVDKKGVIREVVVGARAADELSGIVKKLLAEPG